MALNNPRAWLICYDISDPKRLGRLHRYIRRFAQPVQYSVFYYEGSHAKLRRRMKDLERYIDSRDDDVRAYPIPNPPELHTVGRGALPSCVTLQSQRNAGLDTLLRACAN